MNGTFTKEINTQLFLTAIMLYTIINSIYLKITTRRIQLQTPSLSITQNPTSTSLTLTPSHARYTLDSVPKGTSPNKKPSTTLDLYLLTLKRNELQYRNPNLPDKTRISKAHTHFKEPDSSVLSTFKPLPIALTPLRLRKI